MDFNPIVKKKLECLTSMEQAWERLRSVTKERTPFMFMFGELGLLSKNDNLRYLGSLDKYRFTLTKRGAANWHGIPYYRHQFMVIHGKIEPGSSGCVVNLLVRPIMPIVFVWFMLLLLFGGLLWGVLVTSKTDLFIFGGMAVAALVFWAMVYRYQKIVKEELEFLEVIFGAKQEAEKPQMAPSIG